MTDSPDTTQQPRRDRRPAALALTAVVAGVLAFAVAVGGGLPGAPVSAPGGVPAPDAAASPVAPDAPAAQGAPVVDAGWVAPANQGGAEAPALPGNRVGKLGAITITKIDGPRLSLTTRDGWIRTIDASAAAITRGGQAIKVADVAVGDEIVLRQKRQADGTFAITAIRVVLPKVAGTVTSADATRLVVTAADGTKTTVMFAATTTYRVGKDKVDRVAVKVGMQAVVTGTKAANGTLTATSVNARLSQVGGSVAATGGSTITVTTRKGTTVTVTVGSTTTYKVAGVKAAALADVKADMWIVVDGLRNADGSFTASTVRAAAAGTHKGWGDWKPNRKSDATPKPGATKPPTSNG